ncbi:uncharacterized protein LOC115669762 [Syzygium oleosum]|uniref:uncharacterized protein LOC115669762 n=1 Tax=Syzygium oleosum TaxID=219896 RepID=UPI0024B9AB25|nr:uncharacterized protein LOC115669762 [Syzygium oleosum]
MLLKPVVQYSFLEDDLESSYNSWSRYLFAWNHHIIRLHWQEPCIVFCPHWSLRLGLAVHLLRRWHGDERSLLIWEDGKDSDIALLPFDPKEMKMKVLRCSFLSGVV